MIEYGFFYFSVLSFPSYKASVWSIQNPCFQFGIGIRISSLTRHLSLFYSSQNSAVDHKLGLAISNKKLFCGRRNRRNKWLVPADSGCSAEQKTFGILFRTVPQRRKMLGILFRTIPRKRKTRNSVFVEQKKKQTLGILFRTIPRKRKQLGIPCRGTKIEENPQNTVPKFVSDENMLCILFAGAGYFKKLIFSCHFLRSEPRN
jgi:hypothetical protein